MGMTEYRYQLWCFYKNDKKWVMEDFFYTRVDAIKHLQMMIDGGPGMYLIQDYNIIKVEIDN